jgi:hypothetical protein
MPRTMGARRLVRSLALRSIGVFAEGFAAVPSCEDAGQRRNKGGQAPQTAHTAGMDDQAGGFAKTA